MGIILILGFFIDFVEISLIIVPIFYPIAYAKVSPSLKPIKTIPLWEYNEAD
jgi:TRAP-type C4-dicarboxylate transport system permease large subunit